MNDTLKVIVGVLESGRPELQVAAAQILGELRAKEPSAVRALATALRRSPVLGRFALDALAKMGTSEAYATIVQALLDHEVLADHAAQLLAEAGAPSHAVLAAAYPNAAGEQRVRILGILARSLGKDGLPVFVQALLTPELTDTATRLLLAAADRFDAGLQKILREIVGKFLESPLPESCLANVVTVLSRVDAAGSRATLLRFTDAEHPARVRSAAFRALHGSKLTAAQVRSMLDLLEDQEQKDVHDAVRDVLAELPELPEAMVPVCKRLLGARQPEQRLFALRMLRTVGGAELAKVAMKLLDHDDPRFRAAAADALAHNKQAIEPLIRLLQTTRDAGLAQVLGGILTRLQGHFTPKIVRACAEKVVKLLGNQTLASDLLCDVVVAVGGAKVVPGLVESAVRLRRGKRFAEALHLLARLAGSPHGNDEVRYQLAVAKLCADAARGGSGDPSVPGNATMGFFAALVRSGFPLVDRLRKESALSPEALLRIGSHFADTVGPERRFGTELLQHLAGRTKGRAGEEARVALRAAGG